MLSHWMPLPLMLLELMLECWWCRRAYQKCPAQLSKQGRAEDAALINTQFDVDQISDNCRFRSAAPFIILISKT